MTSSETDLEHITPGADWSIEERIQFWDSYLDARTGTYEFRCRRYDAVIDQLNAMGLRASHSIMDIGAGRMEFARRLREHGHLGLYIPVDGSIDGCDLNTWEPPDHVDWVTGIEVIEHVEDPQRLMARMKIAARFGLVITTPNPATVDVMGMDPTHLCPVSTEDLALWGYQFDAQPMFTDVDDTLIGWLDKQTVR